MYGISRNLLRSFPEGVRGRLVGANADADLTQTLSGICDFLFNVGSLSVESGEEDVDGFGVSLGEWSFIDLDFLRLDLEFGVGKEFANEGHRFTLYKSRLAWASHIRKGRPVRGAPQ